MVWRLGFGLWKRVVDKWVKSGDLLGDGVVGKLFVDGIVALDGGFLVLRRDFVVGEWNARLERLKDIGLWGIGLGFWLSFG